MNQSIGTERTLTTHALHRTHAEVLKELVCGRTFLILHEGRPLARLVSLRPETGLIPKDYPQVGELLLAHLEDLLGQADLARVLGLSLATFLSRRAGLQFPQGVKERMDVLEGVTEDLLKVMRRKQVTTWMKRPQNDLQGRSVLATLAFPWEWNDAVSLQVCHLARRERIKGLTSRNRRELR